MVKGAKVKIGVGLSDWHSTGGASLFFRRLFKALPKYEWIELSIGDKVKVDLLIYGNSHWFYENYACPKILRTQGKRSFNLPQPADLKAVICSSWEAFDLSQHPNRVFIMNGVDQDKLGFLEPIKCDLLCSDSRIGKGQNTVAAIEWAMEQNRHLTVLGDGSTLSQDNTWEELKAKYPKVGFTGLLREDEANRYIKGCNILIMTNPSHGLSNSVLTAKYFDKIIFNFTGGKWPHIPMPEGIEDISETALKYKKLIEEIK